MSNDFLAEDRLGSIKLHGELRHQLIGDREDFGLSTAQRGNPERNGRDEVIEILSHAP